MVPMQPSLAFLTAMFDIFTAAADVMSLWKIGLFTGAPALGINTVLADLTQPTFTGYALAAATAGAISQNANGDILLNWGSFLFQPTAPVTPAQIVTGCFLQATISASATLLLSGFFPAPTTFASALDSLQANVQGAFPNAKIYGGIACEV